MAFLIQVQQFSTMKELVSPCYIFSTQKMSGSGVSRNQSGMAIVKQALISQHIIKS